MPERRRDPLRGRDVILAPGRAARPHDRGAAEADEAAAGDEAVDCPFCPGRERRTPPEVARRGGGAPDGPGWRVRVFPNRYPIVQDGDGPRAGPVDPLRDAGPAAGAHEVVVLSPDHRRSLGRLDHEQALEVVLALQDRARAHAAAGRRYTQVFVNHGAAGGASLAHPHAQVVAVDAGPPAVLDELARMAPAGGCVLCAEMHRHDDDHSLVVIRSEAELWCPWWSASAYELLLAPRRHRPRFEDADEELAAVAAALRDGLAGVQRALGPAPYNVLFHSRPAGEDADYHWHIHIRPRLQLEAGFELATGIGVNPCDPVDAATVLRKAARPVIANGPAVLYDEQP